MCSVMTMQARCMPSTDRESDKLFPALFFPGALLLQGAPGTGGIPILITEGTINAIAGITYTGDDGYRYNNILPNHRRVMLRITSQKS